MLKFFNQKEEEQIAPVEKAEKDVLLVVMSDLHVGSTHALCFEGEWQGRETAIIRPTSFQMKIREVFIEFMNKVREARKGKSVCLVFNGDIIDGDHHSTPDIFTKDLLEQSNLAIDIIEEFKKGIDWEPGDAVYVTRGTDVHTKNLEEHIGKYVNAVQDGSFYTWDLLNLEIFGNLIWFVHHGPRVGTGANEGNALRNMLKHLDIDSLKHKDTCPDWLFTGHVHQPYYAVIERHDKFNFKLMHGVITPSWQQKTKYAHMAAPVARNIIGGCYVHFSSSGLVGTPQFVVMEGRR